jgi:hypothetical protein
MNAILRNGPHAGQTYILPEGCPRLIIEGVKSIHIYEPTGPIDVNGRYFFSHSGSASRPKKGTP